MKKSSFSFFGRAHKGRALRSNLFGLLTSPNKISAAIPRAAIVTVLFVPSAFAQTQQDSTKVETLSEVLVSSVRAGKDAPLAFSNLKTTELATRNLGQDIPILLNFLPSVVTTSDAGNGFGYTGIRVRGSDATRVNVTINGIPYNDSESHGTFWVNLPDFVSSTESIQLQRGVGSSTNGAGAFGASLNLQTDKIRETAFAEIDNAVGSFNSRKHTLKFGSGLLNNRFEISGRISDLSSDGYVDRAFSDLRSYFFQAAYRSEKTTVKALVFGGREQTYQAWYGIDAETLRTNRTFNFAGLYNDANGNPQFYSNETDNYGQDHYQLHLTHRFSSHWSATAALHLTQGKGYFENYIVGATPDEYGLTSAAATTDLIRQKWLDNDFFGSTYSVKYQKNKVDFTYGGALNRYDGLHFGKVLYTREATSLEPDSRYYQQDARKDEINQFAKLNFRASDKWLFYADMQWRYINYFAEALTPADVNDRFSFFNPKMGVTYFLKSNQSLYASYAKAQREPNRTDYETGSTRPEKLNDFELGYRFQGSKVAFQVNGYAMLYRDQLVLTGALDDVGNAIRTNVGKSYRVGVEVDAQVKLTDKISWTPNATWSRNRNQDFVTDVNGVPTALGETKIAFSPEWIAGNAITWNAFKNFSAALLSKYVGQQNLSNLNDPNAQLKAYQQHDINVSYTLFPKSYAKQIRFSVLVNNFLDADIVSNGADFGGGFVVFYPQAGINVLAGVNIQL